MRTTRSAPSTRRRRSRTAPTTSSSGGRSARPPTRGRRRKPSSAPSRLFFPEQLFQQALQEVVGRRLRAVEKRLPAALDQEGREVLDLQVAHLVGVVLGIEPGEPGLRKAFRQREEARAVLGANVAPLGADAGHLEFAEWCNVVFIRLRPCPICSMHWPEWRESSHWHGS